MDNPLKVSLENIIPLTEARDHFSQIVSEVQKDKLYVLTKGGKPAVAIIDVKYLEHITGGEVKKEFIQEEIKKAPEKVGLPTMTKHQTPPLEPTPPPMTPPPPPPPPTPPPSATPEPTIPAAPAQQPPKPPTPADNQGQSGGKIDVQFYPPDGTTDKKSPRSPDDKTSPAQYAGSSDAEPEDMALD